MMNKLFFSTLFIATYAFSLHAENNDTNKTKIKINTEHNISKEAKKNDSNKTAIKSTLAEQQVKEQMEHEKKYAKEQKFYQGDEYDLKAVEINKESLKNIPVIEPDYDFDITDVYRDDL